MPYYSKKQYSLVDFEKSKTKNKKYDAILLNQANNKTIKIPFGHSSYAQFKDSTGLGLYSNKDHGDLNRRAFFRQRHAKDIKKRLLLCGWFSMKYLWT